jgi:hypothetical protein
VFINNYCFDGQHALANVCVCRKGYRSVFAVCATVVTAIASVRRVTLGCSGESVPTSEVVTDACVS